MSAASWRHLVHRGNLHMILEVFGVDIVELILAERRRP